MSQAAETLTSGEEPGANELLLIEGGDELNSTSVEIGHIAIQLGEDIATKNEELGDQVLTALDCLTRTEKAMLELLRTGLSNKQMSKEEWVTEQTVKFHLSNIYKKLGVRNRTEASQIANNILGSEESEAKDLPVEMTRREAVAYALVAEGLSNSEIAQKMGVTKHTVVFHLSNIYAKLGVRNRTEAVFSSGLPLPLEATKHTAIYRLEQVSSRFQGIALKTKSEEAVENPEDIYSAEKQTDVIANDGQAVKVEGLGKSHSPEQTEAEALPNEEPMIINKRLATILQNNIGQPFSYIDLGRLVYPEDLSPNLYSRSVNALRNNRQVIEEALSTEGLILKETKVIRAHNGKPRRVLAFVAESISETIEAEIESTWMAYEAENERLLGVLAMQAESGLYRIEAQAIAEERDVQVQARREVRAWKQDELVYLRHERDIELSRQLEAAGYLLDTDEAVEQVKIQQTHTIVNQHGNRELDEDGFPPGFVERIEELQEKLRHPPSPEEQVKIYHSLK